jgi:hypothetical protein
VGQLRVLAVVVLAAVAVCSAPLNSEEAEALAVVREYALNYVKRLPDFTCTQVTRRTIRPARGFVRRSHTDVIQEQLIFSNRRESYREITINGKKASGLDHREIEGVISWGEFGGMLYAIFDPESGTDFAWNGTTKFRGRWTYVFAYRVPQKAGTLLLWGDQSPSIRAGYMGVVYADTETKQVMRITAQCVNLPRDFPIREVRRTLDYGPIQIAGQEYVLPLRFELRLRDIRNTAKNESEYTSYRKFEAQATITFEGDGKPEQ